MPKDGLYLLDKEDGEEEGEGEAEEDDLLWSVWSRGKSFSMDILAVVEIGGGGVNACARRLCEMYSLLPVLYAVLKSRSRPH